MNNHAEQFKALHRRAERLLKERGRSSRFSPPAPEELEEIFHDFEVHQIELEMQNEELIMAQHELQQAKENYFSLYELAPVGYITLNDKLLIIQANLTAANMLWMERRYLLNRGFSQFINQDDYGRFRELINRTAAAGLVAGCELDLRLPGGATVHVKLECAAEYRKGSGAKDYRLAITDISEIHQTRQALLQVNAELEMRVAERTAELEKLNQRLLASEEKFRTVADYTYDCEYWISEKGEYLYISPACEKLSGYRPEEFMRDPELYLAVVHPDDREMAKKHRTEELLDQELAGTDLRIIHKNGELRWILHVCRPVYDRQGNFIGRRGSHIDITARKRYELALEKAHEELEERVTERTRELSQTNVALEVLLRKRAEDRQALEERILANLSDLVEPYLRKLAQGPLAPAQQNLVSILQQNLKELVSPLSRSVSARFGRLTPAEIQVANLVKLGKKTKEIAELLNLSPGTIDIHRKNIRKKLGLTNQGINLYSALAVHDSSSRP